MGTADNLPDETEQSGDTNWDSVGLDEVDLSEGYQGVTAQGTAWGGIRRVQLTQSVAEALRSSQCSVSDSSTQRHGNIPPMRLADADAYFAARKEAEEHALERERYRDKAQKAFLRGKAYSEKSRKLGDLMHAANNQAASILLKSQNLAEADKIDLHSLRAQEAVEATRDFVKSCIGRLETVQVITGQGSHSDKAKGAVIKPAIINLCWRENWRIHFDPSNPGCLTISVPNEYP